MEDRSQGQKAHDMIRAELETTSTIPGPSKTTPNINRPPWVSTGKGCVSGAHDHVSHPELWTAGGTCGGVARRERVTKGAGCFIPYLSGQATSEQGSIS